MICHGRRERSDSLCLQFSLKLYQLCTNWLLRQPALKGRVGSFCMFLSKVGVVCLLRLEDRKEQKRVGVILSRGLVINLHAFVGTRRQLVCPNSLQNLVAILR